MTSRIGAWREETLRVREERYRTLFEDSPFPMWEEDFSSVKEFLDELKARGVTDIREHLATHRADAEECVRRIRVVDVNRAAREFYGATREQLMGDLNRICDDAAYEVVCEEMGALADSELDVPDRIRDARPSAARRARSP